MELRCAASSTSTSTCSLHYFGKKEFAKNNNYCGGGGDHHDDHDRLVCFGEGKYVAIYSTKAMSQSVVDKFRKMIRRIKRESSGSWTDERNNSFVFNFFREINKLVARMDKPLLKSLMSEDNYGFLYSLSVLLCKDNQWSIQWEIIGFLGSVAGRVSRARQKLLEYLPVHLAREILNRHSEPWKLSAYSELLTLLFTTSKSLPIHLMDQFGVNFVITVLQIIETDDSRPGWAIPDALTKLLLAYNLQFSSKDVYNNLTIRAISKVGTSKSLTSRLIDLLEKKDCPLTSWETRGVSVHQCAIKLATDIFLCHTTSYIFSLPHAVTLLQVLTKTLPNFLQGDPRRTYYLKLIKEIHRHCKYDYIRDSSSLRKLEESLLERVELSLVDQDDIRTIFQKPHHQSEVETLSKI